MKNILDEKPSEDLHGRLLFSTQFVDPQDLTGRRVLDVGCGFGWFEVFALKKGATQVLGVEATDQDLETARRWIKDSRASFQRMSGTELQLPKDSFDTVVSWEVIEHLPKGSEPQLFSGVASCLKEGGVFYLSTPYDHWLSNLTDPAWWLIGHRHYNEDQLRILGHSAGFEIEHIEVRGGLWGILLTLNLYFTKWILRRPLWAPEFFAAKEDQEFQRPGFLNIFVKYRKLTATKH